jgi:ABC-2 type transport system permease protein
MPIFDQGYQHWQGGLSGHAWRWLTITQQGVRTGLRSRWIRLLVLAAWAPAVALAAVLVVWGLIEQKVRFIMPLVQFLNLPEAVKAGPEQFRVTVWTLAYYYFFEIEIFFVMLIVLLVGPALISQDLRFNAMQLYFSRPLRRIDYFLGKLGVIAAIVGLVAVVPALIAYVLGLAFSLDWKIVADTYRFLLASLAYGAIVTVSAGTLMLAFSALSRNSRYVMAMWLGFWLVTNVSSWTVAGIMQVQYEMERRQRWMEQRAAAPRGRPVPPPQIERPVDWYRMLSYTSNLNALCHVMFDTNTAWDHIGSFFQPREREEMKYAVGGPRYPWYWSACILLGLGILSTWVLSFRVKSLDRLR